jgi:hypothetical protein
MEVVATGQLVLKAYNTDWSRGGKHNARLRCKMSISQLTRELEMLASKHYSRCSYQQSFANSYVELTFPLSEQGSLTSG